MYIANTRFLLDGTPYWAQFSGADYAITDVGPETLRFEVRGGDVWAPYDSTLVNRSEVSSTLQIANGNSVHVTYGMRIAQGVNTANDWTVLGQFHQDDYAGAPALSPPFAVSLSYGRLTIRIGYTNAAGEVEYHNVYAENTPVLTNHNYTFDINATFDPDGNGHLSVILDGVHVVEYNGRLGYSSQNSVYWKAGIYRPASSETMVVEYTDLTVTPVTSTAPLASGPVSDRFSVNAYDAEGRLARTETQNPDGSTTVSNYTAGVLSTVVTTATNGVVTTNYHDASGALTKTIIRQPNGARTVERFFTCSTSCSGYAVERLEYDATGNQTRLTQLLADGRVQFERTYGANGRSIYHEYNAAGRETLRSTTYADGRREVIVTFIEGQSYTREVRSYNAAGTMVSLVRSHDDGSLAYTQIIGASGATTISTYDATGHLLRRNIIQPDGQRQLLEFSVSDPVNPINEQIYDAANRLVRMTQHLPDGTTKIFHYGITGQSYTRDVYTYEANGRLAHITRYRDDNTLDSRQIFNTDGSVTYDRYNAAGVLNQHAVVAADGSRVVDQYLQSGTYATTHLVYDASGVLRHMEQYASDGSRRICDYGITGRSYVTESLVYAADGTLRADTRYHADNTLDYIYSRNADGTAYTAHYDAQGHQTTAISTRADGSLWARALAEGVTLTSTNLADGFTLFGGDTLTLHAGFGADHVYGFHAGDGAGHDVLAFDAAQVADFLHLNMQQNGSDVVITLNAHDSVTLHGVQMSALTAADFRFV